MPTNHYPFDLQTLYLIFPSALLPMKHYHFAHQPLPFCPLETTLTYFLSALLPIKDFPYLLPVCPFPQNLYPFPYQSLPLSFPCLSIKHQTTLLPITLPLPFPHLPIPPPHTSLIFSPFALLPKQYPFAHETLSFCPLTTTFLPFKHYPYLLLICPSAHQTFSLSFPICPFAHQTLPIYFTRLLFTKLTLPFCPIKHYLVAHHTTHTFYPSALLPDKLTDQDAGSRSDERSCQSTCQSQQSPAPNRSRADHSVLPDLLPLVLLMPLFPLFTTKRRDKQKSYSSSIENPTSY